VHGPWRRSRVWHTKCREKVVLDKGGEGKQTDISPDLSDALLEIARTRHAEARPAGGRGLRLGGVVKACDGLAVVLACTSGRAPLPWVSGARSPICTDHARQTHMGLPPDKADPCAQPCARRAARPTGDALTPTLPAPERWGNGLRIRQTVQLSVDFDQALV